MPLSCQLQTAKTGTHPCFNILLQWIYEIPVIFQLCVEICLAVGTHKNLFLRNSLYLAR
jgi:hypothetical protein